MKELLLCINIFCTFLLAAQSSPLNSVIYLESGYYETYVRSETSSEMLLIETIQLTSKLKLSRNQITMSKGGGLEVAYDWFLDESYSDDDFFTFLDQNGNTTLVNKDLTGLVYMQDYDEDKKLYKRTTHYHSIKTTNVVSLNSEPSGVQQESQVAQGGQKNTKFRRDYNLVYFDYYNSDDSDGWEQAENTIVYNTNINGDVILYNASKGREVFRKVSNIEEARDESGFRYQYMFLLDNEGEEILLLLYDSGETIFIFENDDSITFSTKQIEGTRKSNKSDVQMKTVKY